MPANNSPTPPTGSVEAFLAEMLLKLVPLGDKYVDGVGVQLSGAAPLFTADEVKRLVAIKNEAPSAPWERGQTVAEARQRTDEAEAALSRAEGVYAGGNLAYGPVVDERRKALIAAAIAQGRAEAEADWRTRASQSLEAAKAVRTETIREVREKVEGIIIDEMTGLIDPDDVYAAFDVLEPKPGMSPSLPRSGDDVQRRRCR